MNFGWALFQCAAFLSLFSPSTANADQEGKIPAIPSHGAIHYKLVAEDKSTKPVLVLVHGLGGNLGNFSKVVPELSKHYRVLLLDQPGHGQSDENPTDDYSATTMARSLNRLLEQVGVEKVTLLGHSQGGRTAAAFTGEFPGKVEKLVIEDMDLHAREKASPEETAKIAAIARDLRGDLGNLHFSSREKLIEKLLAHKHYSQKDAEYLADHDTLIHPDGSRSLLFRPWVDFLYRHQSNVMNLLPALSKTKVPILVLRAENHSGSTEPGIAEILNSRKTPKILAVKINGSDHAIHNSNMPCFLKALYRFTGIEDSTVTCDSVTQTANDKSPESH